MVRIVVTIYNKPWSFFHPKKTAMAPNGNVYFHPEDHLPDFSVTKRDMSWLIHKLAHCWQKQTGQWVMVQGAIFRQYNYGELSTEKKFTSYKLEQEAAIVEDYYRVLNGMKPQHGRGTLAQYKAVIPMLKPK